MNTEVTRQNTGIAKAESFIPAPNLSQRERKIVKAATSDRCADVLNRKEQTVDVMLLKAINKVQAITGLKRVGQAEAQEQTIMLQAMVDVVKRFKWLRLDELTLILNDGMIGEYGDFYSFDARTLNGWIKTYYDKERGKAIKKQAEHEAKQQSIEEQQRKEQEHKQAHAANRQNFIAAYRSVAEAQAEAIESGSLSYHAIPKEIDPKNALFYAFQKKWHVTLGFDREVLQKTLDEELQRQKVKLANDGDWVKAKDTEGMMAAAKSNARSRTFRQRIALMLMAGEDIEAFIKDNDI